MTLQYRTAMLQNANYRIKSYHVRVYHIMKAVSESRGAVRSGEVGWGAKEQLHGVSKYKCMC